MEPNCPHKEAWEHIAGQQHKRCSNKLEEWRRKKNHLHVISWFSEAAPAADCKWSEAFHVETISSFVKRLKGSEGGQLRDSNLLETKITNWISFNIFHCLYNNARYTRSFPTANEYQTCLNQSKQKRWMLSEVLRTYLQFISSFIGVLVSFCGSLWASAPIKVG